MSCTPLERKNNKLRLHEPVRTRCHIQNDPEADEHSSPNRKTTDKETNHRHKITQFSKGYADKVLWYTHARKMGDQVERNGPCQASFFPSTPSSASTSSLLPQLHQLPPALCLLPSGGGLIASALTAG